MEKGRYGKDKLLKSFSFVGANIADQNELAKRKIDTIVNAAKPTLMGSDQGVDGAIHKAIDSAQGKSGYFKDMICNELGTGGVENLVRCQRREAILTLGYGLCKYIIHVVALNMMAVGGLSGSVPAPQFRF